MTLKVLWFFQNIIQDFPSHGQSPENDWGFLGLVVAPERITF